MEKEIFKVIIMVMVAEKATDKVKMVEDKVVETVMGIVLFLVLL